MTETRAVPSTLTRTPTLRGRRVFLSASFPSKERSPRYFKTADPDEMTQAVVALARAVFAANGRIVCGGHPTITPLLMMIAEEYLPASVPARRKRNQIKVTNLLVYQSKVFERSIPSATVRLAQLELGRLKWTPAARPERSLVGRTSNPQAFSESLSLMRQRMLNDWPLAAAVFIGGMEGIEREASMFEEAHPRRPAYYIGAPGGAARRLALRLVQRAEPPRRAWLRELATAREYPALMQRLVAELAGKATKGDGK